jgi:hypothetical protein
LEENGRLEKKRFPAAEKTAGILFSGAPAKTGKKPAESTDLSKRETGGRVF